MISAENLTATRIASRPWQRATTLRRRWLRTGSVTLIFAAGLLPLRIAHADVAPPDSCTVPGQPCGAQDDCTCRETTCSRLLPCSLCGMTVSCPGVGGRGGDGANDGDDAGAGHNGTGFCMSVYSCSRCRSDTGASCLTVDGGTGARSGGGGSGGPSAGAGESGASGKAASDAGEPSGHEGRHHGCSAIVADADVPAVLGFGAVFVLWARRRRRRA